MLFKRKTESPRPTSRRENRPDGRVILVAGSSGSGKTAWAAQQVAQESRLLVWDALGQWAREHRCKPVDGWATLARAVALDSPPRRLAFQPPYPPGSVFRNGKLVSLTQADLFETFCKFAWLYVRAHGATLIVEELSDVTHPGKAPPTWGEIIRKSRHFGATVFAITQRPAESDKTIVGNAALIHAGLQAFDSDRKYIARCLDVPVAQVAALGQLGWIERNMRTRALATGRLSFKKCRR